MHQRLLCQCCLSCFITASQSIVLEVGVVFAMVFRVPKECLPLLIEQLKPNIPKAVLMIGALYNAIEEKIKAKFYTDKWPEVSVVVCEIYSPRISDVADLICYATCNEASLQVLTEGNLITWGQRQLIYPIVVDLKTDSRSLTDYLLANLKPPPDVNGKIECSYSGKMFYLPPSTKLDTKSCPRGYVLGKLQPHHAEYVASHWKYHKDWPNRVSWFEERITKFDSAAIFSIDDYSLVSWNMQYAGRQHANLFTIEDHRRRGLATISKTALCLSSQSILLPQVSITEEDNPNVHLLKKLGFIDAEMKVNAIAIDLSV